MHDPRYDGFAETMRGPTQFELIVAGELEMRGPLLLGFYTSPCNASERQRLLEWLSMTTELGRLLSAVLDRI